MEMEGIGQGEEEQKGREGETGRRGKHDKKVWVEGVFWIASTCFEVNKKSRGPKEKKWGS